MTEKTLKTLEYDKVLSLVSNYAILKGTKQRLLSLTPFSDIESVNVALKKTQEAYKLLFDYGVSGIEFFDEPSDEIERAEKGALLSLAELIRAARLLKASRLIRNTFTAIVDENIVHLPEIAGSLYCDQYLEKEILSKVISDEKLADDASEKLYQLRRKIKKLNEQIRERLNSYIHAGDKFLQENIVTMRGDRYVIPVKSEYRSKIKGFVHDQSSTGSTVFIEPVEVLELNNQLRVTTAEESAEVEEIIRDLSHKIGMISQKLLYNAELIRDIDEYTARATYAYKTRSTMPIINQKGIIDIKRGRHPLIDPKKVVPLDVHLGKKARYLLITGPNTGGKTVTLKLVGLLTLMATSGMFVPCHDQTTLALFDNIFVDVGDEQSIEQSLSTFSSHIKNLVEITNFVDSKSLVLIDEIGAGTDPDEGSALAQAIIEKLLKKGSYGIITTHYSRLKEFAYVSPDIINASMDFDSETFAPIYKLNIGIPGTSNAIEIASRLGLDKQITEYATSLLSENKVSFENVLREAEKTRKTAESERLELVENLNKSKEELALIEKQKQKLESDRAKLYASAKAESRRIINEKVEEADELVEKIKDILAKEEISSGDIITARTLRNKLEEKKYNMTEDEEEPLMLTKCDINKLKIGDTVYVKATGNYGVVQSINPKKEECFIAIGSMRMSVKARELFINEKLSKKKKVNTEVKVSVSPVTSFNTELNIIGKRREEAMDEVVKYLDQAVLKGVNTLRIVHGKGQKILLNAVHEILRKSPVVESFRLGKYGEGENGVTIVTLK